MLVDYEPEHAVHRTKQVEHSEVLDVNSLEQLLINYGNERLQGHFLLSVFNAEGRAYAAEGVAWPEEVGVPDNAELMTLLRRFQPTST